MNRSSTKSLDGKTPYEAWHGKKPAVQHLRTFGCVVYVKDVRPHLRKLDDRSAAMVFIGFDERVKGYRAYDPVNRRVHITRDAIFDEQASWDWEADDAAPSCSDFIITATEQAISAAPVAAAGEQDPLFRHHQQLGT